MNLKTVIAAANARLIDDWRHEALRLWSIRVALFWGAVSGLMLVWPAFATVMPLWAYALGSVFICAGMGVARLTKQPGVEA